MTVHDWIERWVSGDGMPRDNHREPKEVDPEEGTMYPIEREDYVNAYIGAMTEEINKSKLLNSVQSESSGAVDRLYQAVVRILNRGPAGPAQTTDLSPAG
ncbi:MAG: hypothetical protein U9N78_02885 [Actinomycetota bacterium]|nr:hypothetical protein [Actinomycetota bacterium]